MEQISNLLLGKTNFPNLLIDGLPYGLQIFDEFGFSLYYNKKQQELIGLPDRNTGIGSFNVLTDPFSIQNGSANFYKQVYDNKIMFHRVNEIEFDVNVNRWNTRKEKKFFNEYAYPILAEDQKIIAVVAVLSDITESKKTKQSLQENEATLRTIFENSNVGIVLGNEKGDVTVCNPAFSQMIGYTFEELTGKNFGEFTYKEDLGIEIELLEQLTKKQIPFYNIDKRYVTKGGELIWVNLNVACVRNDKDKIVNFVAVILDITDKKKAEEDLKKAKEDAEHANLAKSIFLANMSHEIRTPMNSILGFTDLLGESIQEPTQKNYLNSIQSSGNTLLSLINDILDLSKIEAGKMNIHIEPVEFRKVLEEIKHIFSLEVSKKNLEFIIEIQKDFPSTIMIDDLKVRQILLNLIGNAVKFTETGMIKVSVGMENMQSDTLDLTISIEDTGIGISPEAKKVVFEAFRQGQEKRTREYKGSGLGLAITKSLVEIMNGNVSVKSTENQGSTFSIIFYNVAFSDINIQNNVEENKNQSIVFQKASVLIVDDIDSNRLLIKGYLRNSNLQVIEAGNGQEAIRLAQEHKPNIILMDLRMPFLNGYEATNIIRNNMETKDIPIIAITASAMEETKQKIFSYGFNEYLRKPIKKSSLLLQLSKYLEQK